MGPIYDEDEHEECEEALEGCYRSTLQLAVENDLKTIALCGVSTGIYGYPLREATEVALRTTRAFLDENEDKVCDHLYSLAAVINRLIGRAYSWTE